MNRADNTGQFFEYMKIFNKNLENGIVPNDSQSFVVEVRKENPNIELDERDNDSDVTIHLNHENPTICIPIVDCYVNFSSHQFLLEKNNIALLNFLHYGCTIISNKEFLFAFFKNSYEREMVSFLKEYIVSKTQS